MKAPQLDVGEEDSSPVRGEAARQERQDSCSSAARSVLISEGQPITKHCEKAVRSVLRHRIEELAELVLNFRRAKLNTCKHELNSGSFKAGISWWNPEQPSGG